MKQIFFVLILLSLCSGFPAPARAEAGFQLEKASLETAWNDEYGVWKKAFQLNTSAEWDWAKMKITGRLTDYVTADDLSTIAITTGFPKVEGKLELDTRYKWNERYQILNTGVSYTRDFGERFQATLGYENEWKDGLCESSKYRYQSQQATGSFIADFKPWEYQIKLLGKINDYPVTRYYSSAQTELNQEISWRPVKNLHHKLYYQETAAAYPYDTSLTRSYWETKYGLQGNWKAGELWHWYWDYYRLSQEKDTQTEERQSLNLELESVFDKNNKLVTQLSSGDCNSYLDDEYQAQIPDDDPRVVMPPAVPTLKVAFRYTHKFVGYYVETGCFYTEEHDPAREDALIRTGIFASLGFEYQKMNLTLKASPVGDYQHHRPFYEVKWDYEF